MKPEVFTVYICEAYHSEQITGQFICKYSCKLSVYKKCFLGHWIGSINTTKYKTINSSLT